MPANPSLLIRHPNLLLTLSLRCFSLSSATRPSRTFTLLRTCCSSSSSSSTANSNDNVRSGRSGSLSSIPAHDLAQKIDVNPPKGTRDFPPEDMRLRNWLFHNFREVSQMFAFEEVDFPVLESEALFIRKAGEEIRDQLYCFEDRGNRRVALRPELTPSLARLVIQKGKSLSLPLKWFAVGQCWRYERMTRGRRREHYQWNMDIIGVSDVTSKLRHCSFEVPNEADLLKEKLDFLMNLKTYSTLLQLAAEANEESCFWEAEAELISSIVTFFKRIGITASDVGFKVSSRKVLQEVLRCYSIPNELFGKVCIIIDKIEKVPIDEIKRELSSAELSDEAIEELLQVLSVKSLTKLEEKLGAAGEAVAELKLLFSLAEKFGYSEWIQFDASVVRGLAYYTGIVFEGFDREGKLRAICGGGRYDRLLSTFGGEDIPACGFGFGDAVVLELLKEKGLIPEVGQQVENIVCALDPDLQGAAAGVATILRGKGQSVDLVLENKPLKWVFKRASRINARRLILVGSSEWEKREVSVKHLSSGEQYQIKVDKLE
ncbi:hypothetical protein RHSIM_Rhsim12G0137200 [Rhododendron simsii]|uniref:histidine--tRNA ligase n=1 Tax=Rhododendron simsii TaxID=118357 RepID=A0A834G4Y1_RHOSS|nr:hypothetical protein RHSIM_Rhsim12G0137200 [Rhododendron simsii]